MIPYYAVSATLFMAYGDSDLLGVSNQMELAEILIFLPFYWPVVSRL